MRTSRRRFLIRILERVALALVVLDLGVYLALVRPLDKLVRTQHQRFATTRDRVREAQVRVARLERFQASLPGADEQIKVFMRDHIPPRRRAFSRAARLVRQLSEASGLHLSDVAYKLDSAREAPLQRLGIEVNVEGSFPSLVKFGHALETASDFVVVRDFSFEPAEGGTVALRLAADLYFVP